MGGYTSIVDSEDVPRKVYTKANITIIIVVVFTVEYGTLGKTNHIPRR
jgi:hypothetical protein